MTLIQASHLFKSYYRGPVEVPVLHDVNLDVARGEQVAVVGPSGVGKSTLLHLLGALDRATAGEITLDGERYASLSGDELARVRNRKIGYVFQAHHLLPEFSALENVLMPARLSSNGDSSTQETRARELLAAVGLSHRLEHRPGELSGGECQRVAVARALMNTPALILADEPTGNLDGDAARSLQALLERLSRDHQTTLIVATHNLEFAQAMDRILELHDHRVHPQASAV